MEIESFDANLALSPVSKLGITKHELYFLTKSRHLSLQSLKFNANLTTNTTRAGFRTLALESRTSSRTETVRTARSYHQNASRFYKHPIIIGLAK